MSRIFVKYYNHDFEEEMQCEVRNLQCAKDMKKECSKLSHISNFKIFEIKINELIFL